MPPRSRPAGRSAIAAIALAAATGLGLVAVGLDMTPARPPQPGAGALADPGRRTFTGPPLPRSAPLRISIPAIDVRAEVVPVAADRNGELEVPPLDRPTVAGWYRLGASPGEAGNAVIVGHVDTPDTGPAVFFHLGRLTPGDTIRVTRADGSEATFAVDGVRSYPKDRFPTELVYGGGGTARLRLITCGGRFDERDRNYLDNIVVFATRVA